MASSTSSSSSVCTGNGRCPFLAGKQAESLSSVESATFSATSSDIKTLQDHFEHLMSDSDKLFVEKVEEITKDADVGSVVPAASSWPLVETKRAYVLDGSRQVFIHYKILKANGDDVAAIAFGASILKKDDADFAVLEHANVADLPPLTDDERAKIVQDRKDRRKRWRKLPIVEREAEKKAWAAQNGGDFKRVRITRPVRLSAPVPPTTDQLKDVAVVRRYLRELRAYTKTQSLIKQCEDQAEKRLLRRPNVVIFINTATTPVDAPFVLIKKSQIVDIIRKSMMFHGCADGSLVPTDKEQQEASKETPVRAEYWKNLRLTEWSPIYYDVATKSSARLVKNFATTINGQKARVGGFFLKTSSNVPGRTVVSEFLRVILKTLEDKLTSAIATAVKDSNKANDKDASADSVTAAVDVQINEN